LRKLPFIPGQVYQRSTIHDQYYGNRQSGISPCSQFPYIFIFSGATGEQHGYKDQWENKNVFSYTGEGQVGDMTFTRGNIALRDHLVNGKRVFLFQYVQTGFVRFVSELEFFDADYFETHDRNGNFRIGIKFFFKRVGAQLYVNPEQLQLPLAAEPNPVYQIIKPNTTERMGLVTSRVGQGAYRKSILHRWEYKCAVTKFSDTRILIASHIVPWKDSSDEQRLDVDNGILLSPTYDALFDRRLITFDDIGKIILSDQIELNSFHKIGITGKESIRKMSDGNKAYLILHQQQFHASLL
jgi:5-methylcytosine-specific restriction enzyme A